MSDKQRKYQLHLTEEEMQFTSNALAGFFNVMNDDKVKINPKQTAVLINLIEKFKHAYKHQTPILEAPKKIITTLN